MRKILLLSLLLLTGCITPDHWSPDSHGEMMQRCRVMCKRTGAAGYDSWTAECTCNAPSKSGK